MVKAVSLQPTRVSRVLQGNGDIAHPVDENKKNGSLFLLLCHLMQSIQLEMAEKRDCTFLCRAESPSTEIDESLRSNDFNDGWYHSIGWMWVPCHPWDSHVQYISILCIEIIKNLLYQVSRE